MGTPAYMSPEQVAGARWTIARDLFSLGILIYQMASGQRPFDGATSIEWLGDPARHAAARTELRADLPDELARAHSALSREGSAAAHSDGARRRATSCRDLQRQTSQPATGRRPRVDGDTDRASARQDEGFWIAVLPIKYTGANADLTALAEG